jgi:hypothetical protein
MEGGLGFSGTMVLASPPILGTPRSSNDRNVVGLGSPPLLAREWIHGATKYLVELVKERIESYGTMVFKQQYWERIRAQVSKTIQARLDELGHKFGTSGTSSSAIITRRKNCIMSRVRMRVRNGFGLI